MNCPKLCGNCTFPQNFCTKKLGEITITFSQNFCTIELGEITIFYVVTVIEIYYALACNFTKSDTTALGVCHAV